MAAAKRRSRTHGERQMLGGIRVDVWLPVEAAKDLELLCNRESEERGLPPERCRTAAIVRAIHEAALSRKPQ